MRVLLPVLVYLASACDAALLLSNSVQARSILHLGRAPRSSVVSALASNAEEKLHPAELMGPWELDSTTFGDAWVELVEDGKCECAGKAGRCQEWSATRRGKGWALSFVLRDKLERPLFFDGVVQPCEMHGRRVDGEVRGAPTGGWSAPAGTSAASIAVACGEFSCWPV